MNVQKPRISSRSVERSGERSAAPSEAAGTVRWENCGGSCGAGGGSKEGETAARSTARNLLDQGEWASRIVAPNGPPQRRSFEVHRWLAEVHPRVAQLLEAPQLVGSPRAGCAPLSYSRVNSSFGISASFSHTFSM